MCWRRRAKERLSALCPIDTCPYIRASDRYYFYSVRDVYYFQDLSFISRRCSSLSLAPNFDSILIMAPGRLDPCFIVIRRLIPDDTNTQRVRGRWFTSLFYWLNVPKQTLPPSIKCCCRRRKMRPMSGGGWKSCTVQQVGSCFYFLSPRENTK